MIAAGAGLVSGEFIPYPYIASQAGLVFVWAALIGLATQFFLNMEIERYPLATGETALTGFSRFWRHWGLVFAVLTILTKLWPGWATIGAFALFAAALGIVDYTSRMAADVLKTGYVRRAARAPSTSD